MDYVAHRAFETRVPRLLVLALAGLFGWLAPQEASAQQQKKAQPNQAQPQQKAQEQKAQPAADPFHFQEGPTRADLGSVATIDVPEGYRFTGKEGTRKVLEMLGNPTGQNEIGLLMPSSADSASEAGGWFIVFEFDPIGYVPDKDKDELSPDGVAKILESIKQGNEQANQERKKRGWNTIDVVGWEKPPFYDPASHNLIWAVRAASNQNGKTEYSVNYNTRILARRGVLPANLVVDPDKLKAVVPTYEKLLKGVTFKQGESYAEMKAGDKIAEYGLIGLIAGGAGAVALKTGFLTKFLKPILLGIAAAAAAVWRGIKSIFGGSKSEAA